MKVKRLLKIKPKALRAAIEARKFFAGSWLYLAVLAAFLATGAGIGFLAYRNAELLAETQALEGYKTMLISGYTRTYITLKDTEAELSEYKKDLEITEQQRDGLAKNLGQEKQKVAEKEGAIKELEGTVDVLEKLTTYDPELLQKYSKVFFLNEHYEPPTFFPIPNKYKYYEDREADIHVDVWPYLQGLLLAAERDSVTIYVLSSYRSFGQQADLKSRYMVIYGAGTANQFSADQGYSEHQLGTTVDFITTGIQGQLEGFDGTESYRWLKDNAHKYGFTLSYPEQNGYYIFEPWHWRFVGTKLATDLYNQGKHFYDLTQRELDEYLIYIFD